MDKIKSNSENVIKQILMSVEELAKQREEMETSGITDIGKEWKRIINKGILPDMEIPSECISEVKSNIETLCILTKSLIKNVIPLQNINNIEKKEIKNMLNMTQILFNMAKEMQSVFNQNYSDDIDLSNEYVYVSDKQVGALLQILDLVYLFTKYGLLIAVFITRIEMQYNSTPNKKIRTIKEDDVIENKYVIELMNKHLEIAKVISIIKDKICPIEFDIVSFFIASSKKDIEKFNKYSN